MSRVRELFTFSVEKDNVKWKDVVKKQHCRYSNKRCFKVRKSQANISLVHVQFNTDKKIRIL